MNRVIHHNRAMSSLFSLMGVLMGILSLNAAASDVPQFRIQGEFTGTFAYLNDIPVGGLDLDNDGVVDIIRACSCHSTEVIANGENSDAGYFDDQLVVASGVSGQHWVLAVHQNLLSPLDLSPISDGAVIPEVGNTGVYVLPFVHSESMSYNALVEESVAGVFGPIEQQCFYPDPEIINLDTFYCDDAANVSLLGITTSPFDGNVDWLSAANELWFIERLEDSTFQFSPIFSPGDLGEGTYRVKYIYDAGSALDHTNQTGCKRTAEMEVTVQAAYPMVCNGTVSTSIGLNSCEAVLTPSNLLVGTPEHPENFTIDVVTSTGVNIGPVLTADYVGETLTAIITDNCNGVFCTSNVILNDYHAPVLVVPNDTIISCLSGTTPTVTGIAEATDCQAVSVDYQDEWMDLQCSSALYSAKIIRTWRATDASGNETQAIQEILIKLGGVSDLVFPGDTVFSCSAWLANPNLTDGTEAGAGQPNLITTGTCRIAATFSDDTLPLCGNTDRNFIILRNWTVVNLCTYEILTVDSEEQDNFQFITVRDDAAPELSADAIVLPIDVDQLDQVDGVCASRGFIPAPAYMDDCNEVEIRIFSPIGALDYVNGVDGKQGGYLPEPGLPLGQYTISYEAIDDCGNDQLIEVDLTIVDEEAPQMLCNPGVTLVLPANGNGILYASSIDEGSRDNCCLDEVLIKKSEAPDSDFNTFVEFYCENEALEVTVRAIDCFGNYNECSAMVTVIDNQPPYVIQAPEDEFFVCGDDLSIYNDSTYHAPVFGDNCGYEVSFSTALEVNDCGIGRLIRRWEAKDNEVNPPAIDTQSIWLQPQHDYTITLPSDAVMTCPLVSFNDIELKSFACDMLSANVSFDTLITNSNGLCMSIFRNYTIVNWCEYDGESTAVVLARLVDTGTGLADGYVLHSDGEILLRGVPGTELPVGESTGFYTYQQQVHIVDAQAPMLTMESSLDYCLAEDCLAMVDLQFTVSDDCTAFPFVDYKVKNEAGVFVADTIGILAHAEVNIYHITGRYPEGSYELEIELRDNCGAIGRETILMTVRDCTLPVVTCAGDVYIDLDEEGMYSLQAAQLMESATDECSNVNPSFRPDTLISVKVYGCEDVGVDTLNVWAIDEAGNSSNCSVLVHVRDTSSNCLSFYNITGRMALSEGDGISEVDLSLFGELGATTQSNLNGNFLFEEIPGVGEYTITAQKEDSYSNGVTTFDIIKVQRHLLGTLLLTNPYHILAADVNNSGIISTLDIIYMRKLILGISTSFPNRSSSWFFVPADYEFVDTLQPLLENFPTKQIIAPLDTNKVINFIGIKVGDVNNSVEL